MSITWKDKILVEMLSNQDSWDNLVSGAQSDNKWISDDITDWAAMKEPGSLLWTGTHIYFRVWENDTVVIKSIPRNPNLNYKLRFFGGND